MERFTSLGSLALFLTLIAAGCAGEPSATEYPLKGQIVAIKRDTRQLTVKHEDIPGLMPGMVMSFEVADPAEIDRRTVGELITATLTVRDSRSLLRDIKVTGTAPVEAAVRRSMTPMVQTGDAVPDGEFTDQDGRARRISDWRGSGLVLTFIYTRCPLPDFCPRLERTLLDAQGRIAADPSLRGKVRLAAVTFDPKYDTPEVLKKRAHDLGANPAVWSYLTGDAEAIEDFAGQFGMAIIRNPSDEKDITHNLRTAIIAPDGRLLEVLSGSEWKAEEALAILARAGATAS